MSELWEGYAKTPTPREMREMRERQTPSSLAAPTGSPTVSDFDATIRVLEWAAGMMREVNPSWLLPTEAVIGVMTGFRKIAEANSENDQAERLPPNNL